MAKFKVEKSDGSGGNWEVPDLRKHIPIKYDFILICFLKVLPKGNNKI